MNKIIQNTLLNIRDWHVLQRYCLNILVKQNMYPDEIQSYDFYDGYPGIKIKDGPVLCSFDDLRIGKLPRMNLPVTHTGCLAAYILRYKYPHSLPALAINTGIIPRRLFPAVIHRQHMNTLHDLQDQEKDEFLNMIPVHRGDYVLEIGSYVGFGTVHLSEIVGQTGRIYSIEADLDAFEMLERNVRNNGLHNVRIDNFAVSGQDLDSATFYKSSRQANSLQQDIIGKSKIDAVRVKSLATLLSEIDFSPTFIILTINGSEFEALYSARDFLAMNNHLRVVVPGWYRDSQGRLGERIITLLQSLNFRIAYTKGMHIFAYKNA